MKSIYFFVIGTFLFSCQKQTTNCESIQKAHASSNGPVTIGDSVKLYTQEVGGFRVYSWTGPDRFMSQQPRNTIYNAQLENEGWYYLSLSNNECDTRIDSVYVDINLTQGSPSCSVTNNTCTFNNMGNDTYSSTQKLYDPTTQFLTLQGSGTNTLDINFHHYWKSREPEDGIYETINAPSFGIDGNYNKVFISTIKSNVHFASHENQKVYVSHVNGKLQVRFCTISMGGYNGISFTTVASGHLIQQ